MIRAGSEFAGSDPLIHPVQHLDVDVAALVDSTEIPDEILWLHSLLGLQVWSVQVGVEENDGKGHDEHGVGGVQFAENKSTR